jgi:hypothetical protein
MNEREISIRIRISRRTFVWCMAALLMCCAANEVVSESLTMTTYYPAPSGTYQKLVTTGGTASNPVNTILARDAGSVGIGTTSPHAPAPNGLNGILDVNDIYLRSVGKWGSSFGGGATVEEVDSTALKHKWQSNTVAVNCPPGKTILFAQGWVNDWNGPCRNNIQQASYCTVPSYVQCEGKSSCSYTGYSNNCATVGHTCLYALCQ